MHVAITSAQAEELGQLFEDEPLELDGFEYTLYEESDETNELKYVHFDRIYKRNDDKFFLQSNSKSGSYWSDYEFYYGEELYQVEQVEVKQTTWKVI